MSPEGPTLRGTSPYPAGVTTSPDPVPLEPADLARALAPFGSSRMLPPAAYTSAEVFAWEQRHFFRGWQCIGRSADLAEPGSQTAQAVAGTSVLLVRDEGGELHAFANTCRHRGHELLACGDRTTARAITCPYHLWSYRLDGSLFSASGYGEDARFDFDQSEFPLLPLRVQEWHGWIFLDLSGSAPPLDQHLAGLEERVRSYRPEQLVVHSTHEYVIEANWKVITENYQECYHCPAIHPELCEVTFPDSGENWAPSGGAWVGGWLELREHAVTMSMDGGSTGTAIPGLSAEEQRRVDYIGVFPNLLISLHPDYVMTHRMVPLSANRTWVECSWAFPPEAIDAPGFDPTSAIALWDVTNREDWAACESVQRGLESGHAVAGPLSPREDAIYQFVTMVARGYQGQPLAALIPA